MSHVNEPLLQLFRAHDIDAVSDGDWITFSGRPFRANAEVVGERHFPASMSVQLDVRLEIAAGRTIIESFAGIGETRDKAVGDAIQNLTANSFHVLLAAFFRPGDERVAEEEWLVGGRKCRVILGNVGVRGKPPVQGAELIGWYPTFEAKLKEKQIRPGTHWVRLYYAQMDKKPMACEVLLDNEPWDAMQSEMAALSWPAADEFYGVRIFLVLQVEKGGAVGPETAVAWLADIIAGRGDFTEDEAYAALADAGVPDKLADRAYKFTQVAWGRVFLAGMGVQFSPEYVCFNASGGVMESSQLEEEPCFAAATRLASRYAGAPGFNRIALMSADVNVVNDALHNGSKPEDLVLTPAFLFLEPPTDAGMQNAQQVINEHVAALQQRSQAKREGTAGKPWWKFWS